MLVNQLKLADVVKFNVAVPFQRYVIKSDGKAH